MRWSLLEVWSVVRGWFGGEYVYFYGDYVGVYDMDVFVVDGEWDLSFEFLYVFVVDVDDDRDFSDCFDFLCGIFDFDLCRNYKCVFYIDLKVYDWFVLKS